MLPGVNQASTPPRSGRRVWVRVVAGAVVATAVAVVARPLLVGSEASGSEPVVALPPPRVELAAPPQFLPPPAIQPIALPAPLQGPGLVYPAGAGVVQAGAQAQPVPGGGNPQQLPPPNPLPFGPERVRLPRMGTGILGATPVPTEKELAEFRRFVGGVVDPQNTLDLIQGRARVILLKATPTRTQIADPSIVAFRILEPEGRQVTMIGQKPGITVLNLWFVDPDDKDKEVILSYMVRVFPDPEEKERLEAIYRALELEINKAFPNSRVRLNLIGDKLMLSGQAHDIQEAHQILRIANANAPDGGGPANRPPLASISAVGAPPVLTPTGLVGDPLRPSDTPGLESYVVAGPNVINNLRVPGEQQVMLRVVVAEVNRAAARSIGVDFSITNNNGTTVFSQITGGLIGAANLPVNLDNGQIPVAIRALRTMNYARSLAEPNLTAMNGQTATFLAGGQFPVPVVGGIGLGAGGGGIQGVQFIPFGVQLLFSPIITDRDRIRLTVQATVSTRDNAGGANIGGANVPGLNARTFSSTVELREGQTMAVAGLIQNNIGATTDRVPFFGDLPYIGMFFGSNRTSGGEQELVILVTPELVHPLEPQELTPLPGADVFEPGDLEFYLANRLESRRSYDYRSSVRTDIHRMIKYRECEHLYIVGPSGHVDPNETIALPPGGVK